MDLAEKIDFLPWKDQAPHLIGGDIVPSDAKNTILNESGKWVKAKVPYVISASFSKYPHLNFIECLAQES